MGLRTDDIFTLTLADFQAHQTSTEPEFFNKLPREIIYRILSFLDPEDYVGFADISPLALELSNNQVILEWPKLLTRRFPSYCNSPEPLISILERAPSLKNYVSALEHVRLYEDDMSTYCMGGLVVDDDDDFDFDLPPTQPKFLNKLPPEMIYRILSFVSPVAYVGFAGTCRLALELSNKQVELETLQHMTRNKSPDDEAPTSRESIWFLNMWPDLRNYAAAIKVFERIVRQYEREMAELPMGCPAIWPDEDDEDER